MRVLVWLLLALLAGASVPAAEAPVTRRIDHVDIYHGVEIADPYRWLEDDVRESKAVAEWVRMQNEHTEGFLAQIDVRETIRSRLTELWNFEKYGTPFKAGGRIYFYRNDGLQNQFVLYVQDSLDDEPRVLIDPNTWSDDGTIALSGTSFSDDGRYLAYAVQDAGSDWNVWRIMEIETGKVLDDELRWIKFNRPKWTPDGEGLFYARFPEPDESAAFQDLNLNMAVYYHKVGQPQEHDAVVFHRPDHPEWGYACSVTEDGRYLIITVHVGTDDRYRIYYRDLHEPYALPRPLIDNFEHEYSFIGNDGPVFYFLTDLNAPRKRLIAIDIRDVHIPPGTEHDETTTTGPSSEESADETGSPATAASAQRGIVTPPHREIIPQQEQTISDVSFVGDQFIVETLEDAKTRITLYTPTGELVRTVDLPGIGSASGFGGKRTDTETFYSFSSFDRPPEIYRYELLTGKSELLRRADVDFNPDDYAVTQVLYNSKDGTRVPMFIAHRKDIELDGQRPTLLYGYGGFSIPLTPGFSISRLQWMEMGGVFCMPNIRGGGEYGEEWHRAGTKLNKQNVFDDFIAAAEWLIATNYTQPNKLAIQGGSNGGLLVGACMTQRPDLFGACLPAVGVMDMLRFHKFTAGRYWVDDYGSSDNPEEFAALRKYSPYHNISKGTCYPPTLITTADTDDRVVPGHSFKFAAALQHAQGCDNPILIRVETRAGHGSGKPTTKIIEEIADQWAFLHAVLGMESSN